MLELTKAGEHIKTLRPDQSFEIELEDGEIVHVGAAQDGWEFEDYAVGPYTPPEPPLPSLDVLKEQAIIQVVTFADQIALGLLASFPIAEREAFTKKRLEANAVEASNDITDAPLLTKYCRRVLARSGDDFTDAELLAEVISEAAKVKAKAEQFEDISAATQDLSDQAKALIAACPDAEAIEAALGQLKAAAQAELASILGG